MNKISIYVILLLLFLGLSKGLSLGLSDQGASYLESEESLSYILEDKFLTAILVDTYQTGFLIKTYYQKYKIIQDMSPPQVITVRTSRKFSEKHKDHIGMSIYSRDYQGKKIFLPHIPGFIFINLAHLGYWKETKEGNEKYWHFYRSYRHLKNSLGWGTFIPSSHFFEKSKVQILKGNVFFGEKNEFGTNGIYTIKNIPEFYHKSQTKKISLKQYLKKMIQAKTIRKNHERTI